MKNKSTIVILVACLVVLLCGAYLLYTFLSRGAETQQLAQTPTRQTQEQTDKAPDFTVYDINGNQVKLSDFVGKPTVVNFWASWCGPCQLEMPDFQAKFLELGDRVNFLMVNMTDGSRETVDTASSFITEQGYTFPVYYDTAQDAAATYGVYSLPTTYFLDAQGNGVAQATGAIDADTLQKGIDMILNQTEE